MKEITISITPEQERFLKMFAANHHPGAADNLATHNPIHVVQKKCYRHIPYSPDLHEFYDDLPLQFAYKWHSDNWFDSEVELVRAFYEDRDKEPPVPIKTFNEMDCKDVKGKDGKTIFIIDYYSYFRLYGIKDVVIAWQNYNYENVAFFFILEEARRYLKYQSHNLKEPRTYTYSAGYANEGEYQHFWKLLFNIGKQLNSPADVDACPGRREEQQNHDTHKFTLRPALPEEARFFYDLPKVQDAKLGAIGKILIDFGKSGKGFWYRWLSKYDEILNSPEESLNSPEFKAELKLLLSELRENGPLKDLTTMCRYCEEHGGQMEGSWLPNYGYVIERKNYRYLLRCDPNSGNGAGYHAYLFAFDLRRDLRR
jgi:hypothetical protein